MSIVAAPAINHSSVKPFNTVCYDNNLVLSQGIFLGDNPLQFSLPLMLVEIPLVFFASTIVHRLLSPLAQTRTVTQIITGILLGRSVIGRSLAYRTAIFPPRGTFILDTVSLLSLILFLFSIGVKTDVSLLRKSGKRTFAIGIAGSVIPFCLSFGLSKAFQRSLPLDLTRGDLMFQLTLRLSLSSFPVVADNLDELGLLNSELGRIAMSATLVTDVMNWCLSSVFEALVVTQYDTLLSGLWSLFPMFVFVFVVFAIVRPSTLRVIKRMPPGELLGEGAFVALMMVALFAGDVTEISGFRATMGPFVLGLALPGGMPLGVTLRERLDCFLSGLFVPLFLVLAGYRTDFTAMNSMAEWWCLALLFIICYLGKLVGVVLAGMCFRMSIRDAITVGVIMNLRGIIEVSFFNSWGDSQAATSQHFSMLMTNLVINTAITTPLIKLLYNPSTRYIARKRRTIQHAKPGALLRVLVCIHHEDNVAAFLDLLEASHPTLKSPIAVFVLHLSELAGRAASILRPYKKSKHAANPTASDRVANAFRYFEQQGDGVVSVHPYTSIAPYATMHTDVCALAYSKKASLILLPFHKQSDGTHETAKHSIRTVNAAVLDHAPCSVAVLVDRGLPSATCTYTNHLIQRIAVYFIGGADDREALSYAIRMAGADGISLSVVRFFKKEAEPAAADDDDALDDQVVLLLRDRMEENENIMYAEKAVADGEGMVAVIRSMSEKFDLLMVGRRKGVESELTKGLSDWSECPELGILGDLLSSTDFGEKVSILVVQQQQRMRGGRGIDTVRRTTTTHSEATPEEAKEALFHRDVQVVGTAEKL